MLVPPAVQVERLGGNDAAAAWVLGQPASDLRRAAGGGAGRGAAMLGAAHPLPCSAALDAQPAEAQEMDAAVQSTPAPLPPHHAHIEHHAVEDEPASACRVQGPDLIERVAAQPRLALPQPLPAVLLQAGQRLLGLCGCLLRLGVQARLGRGSTLLARCEVEYHAAARSMRASQPPEQSASSPPVSITPPCLMHCSPHLERSQPQPLRRRQQRRAEVQPKGWRLPAQGQRL